REIINIKENYKLNENKNLIIISDFNSQEEHIATEISCKVKAYDINNDVLGVEIEKLNEPFYFNIDEKLNISNIYRPTNFLEERSRIYFDFINSSLRLQSSP